MISVPQELWEFTLVDSSFANCWLKQESCLAQLHVAKFTEYAAQQLRRWRYRLTARSLGFHPRNLGSTPSSAAKKMCQLQNIKNMELSSSISTPSIFLGRCRQNEVDTHLVDLLPCNCNSSKSGSNPESSCANRDGATKFIEWCAELVLHRAVSWQYNGRIP